MRSIRGAVTAPRQLLARGSRRASRRLRCLRAPRPGRSGARARLPPSSRPPRALRPRARPVGGTARRLPRPHAEGPCACARAGVGGCPRGRTGGGAPWTRMRGGEPGSPVTRAAHLAPGSGGRPGGCRSGSAHGAGACVLVPSWPGGHWGPRLPRALTFADLALTGCPGRAVSQRAPPECGVLARGGRGLATLGAPPLDLIHLPKVCARLLLLLLGHCPRLGPFHCQPSVDQVWGEETAPGARTDQVPYEKVT